MVKLYKKFICVMLSLFFSLSLTIVRPNAINEPSDDNDSETTEEIYDSETENETDIPENVEDDSIVIKQIIDEEENESVEKDFHTLEKYITCKDGSDYIITLKYNEESGIPAEEVILQVNEVENNVEYIEESS